MFSLNIAKFLASLRYEKIPQDVVLRAKELILDTIGVALASSNEPSVINALKTMKNLPYSTGNSKVWGFEEKLLPNYAAMMNAISSHALDFDDTHTGAIVHGSAMLTPLCLTYAESLGIAHKDILTAFIGGWEIASRVGMAGNGSFHKRGFHTTAIAGIFGTTAAMCIILKLNEEQCVNAIGLAGSYASGINEFLSNGSDSKVIHVANCVNNGILAANFAKNGLKGPLSIFEGRDNIFKTFGKEEQCYKTLLIEELGKNWQTTQVSIKPYPSCHFAHGFIDCTIELKKDGFKNEDIDYINCFVDEVPINFICDPIQAKYAPKTAYEAKFSMPFLMSLGFNDGYVNLHSYENLHREEILNFAKKIRYEKHKSTGFPKYFPGHIEAFLHNKKIVKKDVFINKGNFDNPLSYNEILFKFKNCVLNKISEEKSKNIIDGIANYEISKPIII